MNSDLQIDRTLRTLGSVQPPDGIEARVAARIREQGALQTHSSAHGRAARQRPRREWSLLGMRGAALDWSLAAAAVALCAVMVGTAFVVSVSRQPSPPHSLAAPAPHVTLHPGGGFGAASAVHLPAPAAAVPPHTIHGRGHARARTGRALLPEGTRAPLPRGVAVPNVIPENDAGEAAPRF